MAEENKTCAYGTQQCGSQARLEQAQQRAREVLTADGFAHELVDADPLEVLAQAFGAYSYHIRCPVQQMAVAIRHSLEGLVQLEVKRAQRQYGTGPAWRKLWRESEPETYRKVCSAQTLLMKLFTAEIQSGEAA